MKTLTVIVLAAFFSACNQKPKQRTVGKRLVVHIVGNSDPSDFHWYVVGEIPGDTLVSDTINMMSDHWQDFIKNYYDSIRQKDSTVWYWDELRHDSSTLFIEDTAMMRRVKIYADSVARADSLIFSWIDFSKGTVFATGNDSMFIIDGLDPSKLYTISVDSSVSTLSKKDFKNLMDGIKPDKNGMIHLVLKPQQDRHDDGRSYQWILFFILGFLVAIVSWALIYNRK